MNYKTNDLPDIPQGKFVLPALTAGIQNQGLNNFVPKENATILKNVITISANGANTGATFYQSQEFTVLQDSYAIKWKFNNNKLNDYHFLFLVGAIRKTIYGNYEWTKKAGWERIKSQIIQLPTYKNKIDFDFMESFVAELEAQRVAELEAQRVAELEAYLSVTGLKDYELTEEEKCVLDEYDDISFEDFNILKIFKVKNTKSILSRDVIDNSGTTPYLCASADNNSISSYIKYKKDLIDEGNCIFIGGKTFVVTYQENDFYSNDSHNLGLYLIEENYKNKFVQLYLATCVKKSLSHKYSWGDSVSKTKIKSDNVSLPVINEKIVYDKMQTFISAIQKLVIKDVVLYADKKIAATQAVVDNQ